MTGLAWADDLTLVSIGAGDAILTWRLHPNALLTPDSHPNLVAVIHNSHVQAGAPEPAGTSAAAANMTEAFDSFHSAEPGLLQQSLEAATVRLEAVAKPAHADGAAAGAGGAVLSESIVVEAISTRAVTSMPTNDATGTVPVESGHQVLADIEDHAPQHGAGAVAVESEPQLTVERVVGYNGESQGTCTWLVESDVLVYAAGQYLIVEQLATRSQR